MKSFTVVGMMSGTSLDGLDIALCTFRNNGSWKFTIDAAATTPYSVEWLDRLRRLPSLQGEVFLAEHVAFGTFLGEEAKRFLDARGYRADFIASHGHTVFHQPHRGFTFQAGAGPALATAAGLPVVYDFRSADVALGGQGAPLVPVGDRLLFPAYDYCLNLGGIANISFEEKGMRKAFDVCPCNLVLNELAVRAGMPYDDQGRLAASGRVDTELLARLEALPYYEVSGPRSLGREDIERDFLPLLHAALPLADVMATCVEHIAQRISAAVDVQDSGKKMLVTGGGAWNTALVKRIAEKSGAHVDTAGADLIDFKEALVFAFLGVLRWQGSINVLESVTGASRDHCAGSIVLP